MESRWVNEQDWLGSENPHHLLHVLEALAIQDARKLRLAAAACCRRAWPSLLEPHRKAVEAAERFADGKAGLMEMRRAGQVPSGPSWTARVAAQVTHREASVAAARVLYHLLGSTWGGPRLPNSAAGGCWSDPDTWRRECRSLCDVLRDVFGNPFRAASALEPSWRTPTVLALARSVYEERAFDHLPIFGDALEEAGCTEAAVLAHCRESGPHARGCWVLDELLHEGGCTKILIPNLPTAAPAPG